MASIIEFYVACNPPLLPQGVSEVIRRVQDAEGLLEILYEPHVPWFKCIALLNQQHQVTAAVQDNLFAIADEDVDVLDIEKKTDGDISIISDDPRMTSWSEYQSKGSAAYTFADGDVYPDHIAECKYKTIWRGLENHPSPTFEALLDECMVLCDGESAENREQFEAQTSCQISYNTRQTLVYVGSDRSRETLERTVERLDSMAEAYDKHWHYVRPKLLPPLEALPDAELKNLIIQDPFDDIPREVNSTLQGSMAPALAPAPGPESCPDPFDNQKSLL